MPQSHQPQNLQETISFLQKFKDTQPNANKADLQKALILWCDPKKDRSVFVSESFALRFCEANLEPKIILVDSTI
jgi:hypothetical protein